MVPGRVSAVRAELQAGREVTFVGYRRFGLQEAENERLAGEVERHGEEQREARRELAQCQDRLAALQSEHAQAAQTITGQVSFVVISVSRPASL